MYMYTVCMYLYIYICRVRVNPRAPSARSKTWSSSAPASTHERCGRAYDKPVYVYKYEYIYVYMYCMYVCIYIYLRPARGPGLRAREPVRAGGASPD